MLQDVNNKIPAGVLSALQAQLNNIEKGLLTTDPQLPSYLKETHRTLIAYPETAHLLEDSEMRAVLDAQQKWTNTEIVKATAAKKKSTKAKDYDPNEL